MKRLTIITTLAAVAWVTLSFKNAEWEAQDLCDAAEGSTVEEFKSSAETSGMRMIDIPDPASLDANGPPKLNLLAVKVWGYYKFMCEGAVENGKISSVRLTGMD